MNIRAANRARKNATFASFGESLWTGPGGASQPAGMWLTPER
jgi:hypothetical protein